MRKIGRRAQPRPRYASPACTDEPRLAVAGMGTCGARICLAQTGRRGERKEGDGRCKRTAATHQKRGRKERLYSVARLELAGTGSAAPGALVGGAIRSVRRI